MCRKDIKHTAYDIKNQTPMKEALLMTFQIKTFSFPIKGNH